MHKMLCAQSVYIFVILTSLSTAFSEQSNKSVDKLSPPHFKVSLSIINMNPKISNPYYDTIQSYLGRELRSLADVDIVDYSVADYRISVYVLPVTFDTEQEPEYVSGVVIYFDAYKRIPVWPIISNIPDDFKLLFENAVIHGEKLVGMHLVNKDGIKELCSDIIVKFDQYHLESARDLNNTLNKFSKEK